MAPPFLLAVATISLAYVQAPPASVPESERQQQLVTQIQDRIADWIRTAGDAEGDWLGDRARLEMQLATARLELAAVLLVEARSKASLEDKKSAVLESLKLVQDADRTLDRVNIERLDDFDRRAYRGLSAMRHRVTSLQVHLLLGMANAAAPLPTNPSLTPSALPPPETDAPVYTGPTACRMVHPTHYHRLHRKFHSSRRCWRN